MRRRLLWMLLLLAPVLFLSSCKEDEDPVPAIAGTWVRVEYELTNLPTGFKGYADSFDNFVGESGYTIVFKGDGTYARTFTPYVNDEGKWTLEGTELNLSITSSDDLDDYEDLTDAVGFDPLGLEYEVEGDITEARMVLSRVVNVALLPDNFPAGQEPTDADYKNVDVTVLYKFNKLN